MSVPVEGLTQRELQVAILIAEGLSDREVAEKLVITRRTAGWHVEQILAKLNLKSRSQIAARVTQAKALGSPLLAGQPGQNLPIRQTAFLGYNAGVSTTHELLATTRWPAGEPENTEAERRERLISLANAGYNPVIVGYTYTDALSKIARLYPNIQFAVLDDASLSTDNKNVTSLLFADHQGSYLVGAIAARASRTGIIGFVGGVDDAFIRRFHGGYVAGARAVAPNIKVQVEYLSVAPDFSGFASPAKARIAAHGMYVRGADVVYHAAGGSGDGVVKAAKAAGVLAIGVDSDQFLTAPADEKPFILTSMVKRVDVAVNDYLQAQAGKSPQSRVRTADLASDGVGYSKSNPLVQPYVAMADDLRRQIIAGKITVPDKP